MSKMIKLKAIWETEREMVMNILKIREMVLEAGRPKIAVPIVSADPKEIIAECESIRQMPCQILEWRADK